MQTRVSLFVAALTLAAGARAQTSRGAISGTVTDNSGGMVANAAITLTHAHAGVRRSTVSNGAGMYRFDAVDLGLYELSVAHPGIAISLTAAYGACGCR